MSSISKTVKQAVMDTGISKTGLYDLLARGVLEGRKFGRTTLITTASLEAYIASLPPVELANMRKPEIRA